MRNGYIEQKSKYGSNFVLQHRVVMENILKRKLTKNEVVHHLDLDRTNNNPDNLIVFKTNSDHSRFHKTGIKIKNNDVYISPKTYITCSICDNIIEKRNKSRLCRNCFNENMCNKIKAIKRPTKEDLYNYLVIEKKSFTCVGKIYQISDNAIRNWCKKYGLPYRKKDM